MCVYVYRITHIRVNVLNTLSMGLHCNTEGSLFPSFSFRLWLFLVRSRERDRVRAERRYSRERVERRSSRDRLRRGRSASPPGPEKPPEEPPVKRKKEELDPILTRTGGAYIPPAKLRMMQAQITDKSRSVHPTEPRAQSRV